MILNLNGSEKISMQDNDNGYKNIMGKWWLGRLGRCCFKVLSSLHILFSFLILTNILLFILFLILFLFGLLCK